MKQKHVFCAISGGVDSTYMVMKLAKAGHRVTCGYINLMNNPQKTKREKAAIKRLQKIALDPMGIRYLGEIAKFSAEKFSGNLELNQPLIWLTGLIYALPDDVDEIALGFVMNDSAVSFLPEITRAYRGMSAMLTVRPPRLTFPVVQDSKSTIWALLDQPIRDTVTWCESAERDRCLECGSCKRMISEGLIDSDTIEKAIRAKLPMEEVNPVC